MYGKDEYLETQLQELETTVRALVDALDPEARDRLEARVRAHEYDIGLNARATRVTGDFAQVEARTLSALAQQQRDSLHRGLSGSGLISAFGGLFK